MSKIHIIGGGTFSHVRNHLALAAPAFGATARALSHILCERQQEVRIHLTKMADHTSDLVTNADVATLVDTLVADPETRCIVMNAALCDYDGSMFETADNVFANTTPSGSHEPRLKTAKGTQTMLLRPADKILSRIRRTRKDIFLVAFKTTTGATHQEQYLAGLNLLKANSCNLVLANDTVTRINMTITPEETFYRATSHRQDALEFLTDIMLSRMTNTFTRSTVKSGHDPIPWDSHHVPQNLREVVDFCIERGAYKPFRGATVGHFAARVDPCTIVTSARKHDFNKLHEEGMVLVEYEAGADQNGNHVTAYGRKPSVGGMSQKIIFDEHPDVDCIVHFHCPPRPESAKFLSTSPQWPNECGSHQCGENTSRALQEVFPGVKAVFLDNHGPNIVFSRNTPANDVIAFIDRNFDLSQKTGGPVAL